MKPCDENILKALEFVQEMTKLAEIGDVDSEDDSCNIHYGTSRDSAYQIRKIAVAENDKHIKKRSRE